MPRAHVHGPLETRRIWRDAPAYGKSYRPALIGDKNSSVVSRNVTGKKNVNSSDLFIPGTAKFARNGQMINASAQGNDRGTERPVGKLPAVRVTVA